MIYKFFIACALIVHSASSAMQFPAREETFAEFPQEHSMISIGGENSLKRKVIMSCVLGAIIATVLYYKYPAFKKRITSFFNNTDKKQPVAHDRQEYAGSKNHLASILETTGTTQPMMHENQKIGCSCACVQRLGYCPCIAKNGVCYCT